MSKYPLGILLPSSPRFQESLRLLLAWFDADGDVLVRKICATSLSDAATGRRHGLPPHQPDRFPRSTLSPSVWTPVRQERSRRSSVTRSRMALRSVRPRWRLAGERSAMSLAVDPICSDHPHRSRHRRACEVPRAPAHRINVVVPVLTLMGLDDAPATYDGVVPLPAGMARRLAAGEEVWTGCSPIRRRGSSCPSRRISTVPPRRWSSTCVSEIPSAQPRMHPNNQQRCGERPHRGVRPLRPTTGRAHQHREPSSIALGASR